MRRPFIGNIYVLILIWSFTLSSCQNPEVLTPNNFSTTQESITTDEAKNWFEQQKTDGDLTQARKSIAKKPSWDEAIQMKFGKANAIVVPLEDNKTTAIPRNRYIENSTDKDPKKNLNGDNLNLTLLTNLLVYKKNGETVAEVVCLLPNDDFYDSSIKKGSKYNGLILSSDLNGNPLHGYQFKDGKIINTVSLIKPESPNARPAKYQIIGWIDYYYKVDGGNGYSTPRYSYSDPIYGFVDDNFANNGGDYLSITGGGMIGGGAGGSQGYYFPGNYEPEVKPFDMVKCFFAASNSNRNFQITVFVDQPGSNVGGSSTIKGDVGHTFVSFKSTDQSTGNVIERIFGFYPTGSVEALVGTQSRINNNEGHVYDVSITYQVTASQMSQAAQAALSNASRQYVLSGYNCTNYAESICDAAGISLPESSKKIWEGNSWVFIHSPGKLGKELRDLKNSNPSLPIHVPSSPENAPYNKGNCN